MEYFGDGFFNEDYFADGWFGGEVIIIISPEGEYIVFINSSVRRLL